MTTGAKTKKVSPLKAQCIAHIQAGEKLQAVKVYKEAKGVSLAEAKDVIDRLAEKLQAEGSMQYEAANIEQPAETHDHSAQESDGSLEERCLELIKSGNILQAVKLYKDESGAGLKDAKDMIDSMVAQLKKDIPSPQKGCGATIVIVIIVTTVLGMIIL
jgi:ribosomal protein L7/L12